MEMYFVYILIDPRNNLPFYVGKGKRKRHLQHEKEYDKQFEYYSMLYNEPSKMLSLKLKVFHDLRELELKYTYHLIENLSEQDAFILEEAFISWFGRKICGNGILTNLLSGGNKGDLYFNDQTLISLYGRQDLLEHILKYERTSTEWLAKEVYFYNPDNSGYPFDLLKIDWLYNYHGCFEQYAILVLDKLKYYDSVITPFYWVRKISKENDYEQDNTLIHEEGIDFINGIDKEQRPLLEFEMYKKVYNEINRNK
jgi:hypothetical protein